MSHPLVNIQAHACITGVYRMFPGTLSVLFPAQKGFVLPACYQGDLPSPPSAGWLEGGTGGEPAGGPGLRPRKQRPAGNKGVNRECKNKIREREREREREMQNMSGEERGAMRKKRLQALGKTFQFMSAASPNSSHQSLLTEGDLPTPPPLSTHLWPQWGLGTGLVMAF